MLEAISRDTEKFIETYATQTNKNLELKYAGGIQKCLELLVAELKYYLERDDVQLIPALFHHRENGLMMSANESRLDIDDKQPVFEFGFSNNSVLNV